MSLLQALSRPESRSSLSLGDYYQFFTYGGLNYNTLFGQTLQADREEIETNFEGYVHGALKSSGPVFTAIRIRMALFSDVRPMWRDLLDGRPGDLSYTPQLDVFKPSSEIMASNLVDADLAGTSFTARRPAGLKRMRPDWTTIVLGVDGIPEEDQDPNSLDADVLGYVYTPGGHTALSKPVSLLASEVARFTPMVDPSAHYRGVSWLTPVVKEILGDRAATTHKLKFFENGATPNLAITLDPEIDLEKAKEIIDDFRENYSGATNAYKTLALAAGAKVTPIGIDFQQLDFKVTQGYGESRIFEAAGIHPAVAGSSEGLQGASLNAGNYGQASRNVADITLRNLWKKWCHAYETLVPPPPGKELWYDDSDVKFLQEDQRDAAEIQATKAQTITALLREGFTAESAVDAVLNDDFTLLEHSGNLSVQLQPGTPQPNGDSDDTDN